MKNYNLGSLRNWRQVAMGELTEFAVPQNGFRAVSFELIADAPVAVRAVSGDDAWLLAMGDGHMNVKFSIDTTVGVVVLGDPAADVFIRTRTETQVIPESEDPTYTSIEPRPAGPSDEVKRMMHIMRLNEVRRDQQLQAAIAEMRKPEVGQVIQRPSAWPDAAQQNPAQQVPPVVDPEPAPKPVDGAK